MLLCNPKALNGTRPPINCTSTHVHESCILGGEHDRKPVFINCITLHLCESNPITIPACFQFPVCPTFAMTINKSQGQSVRHVGIALCTSHAPCTPGTLLIYQTTQTFPDSPNHLMDKFLTTWQPPLTTCQTVLHPAANPDPDTLDERHCRYISLIPLLCFIHMSCSIMLLLLYKSHVLCS